jgi:hypothetical protein
MESRSPGGKVSKMKVVAGVVVRYSSRNLRGRWNQRNSSASPPSPCGPVCFFHADRLIVMLCPLHEPGAADIVIQAILAS